MAARSAGVSLLGLLLTWLFLTGGLSTLAADGQPGNESLLQQIPDLRPAPIRSEPLWPNRSANVLLAQTPFEEDASTVTPQSLGLLEKNGEPTPSPLDIPDLDIPDLDMPDLNASERETAYPDVPDLRILKTDVEPRPFQPAPFVDEPSAVFEDSVFLNQDEEGGTILTEGEYETQIDDACLDSGRCGSREFWFRADYLSAWTNGSRLPALVTTSSITGTPPAGVNPGALDESTTTVLFGGSRVNNRHRSNARFSMGFWFDGCRNAGIEGDYYDLGQQSAGFTQTSAGFPSLFRPFYNATTPGAEFHDAQPIAYPGWVVGCVSTIAKDYFESAGLRWRRTLVCWEPDCYESGCGDDCGGLADGSGCIDRSVKIDLLLGYRYNRLTDRVSIREDFVYTPSGTPPWALLPIASGTMFNLTDSFKAINEFHGGEVGLLTQIYRGRWSMEFLGKMAIGSNHQVVTITGSTTTTVPGQQPAVSEGGFLALQTNIGHYTRNEFVIIPQFQAEVSYEVNSRLRAFVGYNFLWWANVSRAGETIDFSVNTNHLPPPVANPGVDRPAFDFGGSNYIVQGMTVGFELSF